MTDLERELISVLKQMKECFDDANDSINNGEALKNCKLAQNICFITLFKIGEL